MSTLGDALATALSAINTAAGIPTIEYRAASADPWAAISGAVWHREEDSFEYDDARGAEVEVELANLIVPESGATLAYGYEVRYDESTVWAVIAGPTGLGHNRYRVRRRKQVRGMPDRGAVDA